jgi:N-acetylmuramoyl-L-alanine amidase
MKTPTEPVSLLATALAMWLGFASYAQGAVEHARLAGQDYVRLSDWARENGLNPRWLKQDEVLELKNRAIGIVLGVDRRETRINGVQVWLLFPVLLSKGTPYLAQLDAQTTLLPLLSPPKNRSGTKIKTVCLDAGHGGRDTGNREGANHEKQYTLLLAQEVGKQLVRAGFRVVLTRSTDTFVELPTRPEIAKRRGADLFVSLHFNAAEATRTSAQGAEVYCLTPAGASSTNAGGEGGGAGSSPGNRFNEKNLLLAYHVQKALTRGLGVEDRGLRRARFAVLRDAVMPATLVEAGFMSHPKEGRKILTAAYRQKMGRAIVEGVLAYKRQVEK